jgi:hypothetical protein
MQTNQAARRGSMFKRHHWSCIDPDCHVTTTPFHTQIHTFPYLILCYIHTMEGTTRREVVFSGVFKKVFLVKKIWQSLPKDFKLTGIF